ncbi:DMT family transporter [Martelella soudanensis]|uniref:DMT family transporter n=1 Tax=unclassified Martelella TaxID=2629616 RepID=UPI0015DDF2B0|nr:MULTISPECIES: DMT family transporter [unclassified Martelella]
MSSNKAPNSGQLAGIALITFAVLLLSLSDALVKLTGAHYSLGQLILMRSLGAGLLLCLWAWARGRRLGADRPLWVTLRSLCLVAMWFFYYAALPEIPLALAAACFYTAPLWMALISRVVLGEPLGLRRLVAVIAGAVGVFLAVNPAAAMPSPYVVLPLLAAFCYALSAIITWSRCRDERPVAMAFNLNVALVCAGGGLLAALSLMDAGIEGSFIFGVWPQLGVADRAVLGLLAAFLMIITVSVAGAYRMAPAPVIGLFDNAYLVFAAIWGVAFFGQVPSPVELTGMGLILAAATVAARAGTPAPSRIAAK